ncbi:15-cis-phytoene desaturase, chloroplastic/chromoplastic [Oryza brachyantha]|uniref:15-cis-phytoene desaturase, chloroplastic/chromoplastic n=1 Tax=Oryza brachyantha TaxID=4533 RepID=UPI001ADD4E57|nr:15-cis-phytoene desaturase, chloroplastic/chromoplastic [Oryza brachyantha]
MHVHAAWPVLPAAPPKLRHHGALRLTVTCNAAAAAAVSSSSSGSDGAGGGKAVIVGGGLAGLAAATHLASLSVPFTLLEASDSLGGRVATDEADGYRFDRGFQIFLTAYPECRRLLDFPALRLRPFYPGALVFLGAGEPFHLLSDPFRLPLRSVSAIFSPVGTLADKVLVGLTRLRAASTPDEVILSSPETTTARHLEKLGFSPSIVERFLRPFLAGIFFDPALDTSSRLFELVFKRLALGDNALPEAGIGALASQLADRLPEGSVRLNSRAAAIDKSSVTLDTGETVSGELGVIVAVEQPEAEKLLPQLSNPSKPSKKSERSTVCLYFAADRAAVQDPILLLNGSGKGIVNNMFFATNVSPSYAPAGKVLVSVSLVGSFADRADADLADEVVRELGGWFGAGEVASWTHLRTYRIGFAQPDQTPPTAPAGRDPRVGDGLYVCGDHWCSATFDGALVSGRRAAEALAQDRGLSTA